MPLSPLLTNEGIIPPPPIVSPPLRNTQHETALAYRASVINKWIRSGDASFPLISFNWRDNLSPRITSCDQTYLGAVGVEFSASNVWAVEQARGELNPLSGEDIISARSSQDINPKAKSKIVAGLKELRIRDSS